MFGHLGASKRRWGGLAGAGLVLALGAMALFPSQAWATDDSVDSWDIRYTVQTDGVLHVDETLVYRFGTDSGRHGIDRLLTTREAWDDQSDVVWTISDVQVTSPDASATVDLANIGSGRYQQLRIRIGDANETISNPTATYALSYDVTGALRTSDDPANPFDELYWDALGGTTPLVQNITVTVNVPGGVTDVACFAGPVKSTDPCTSASIGPDGVATFTQASKPAGDTLTIAAKITAGLISDNQPHLLPRGDVADTAARNAGLATSGGTAALTAVVVAVLARRNRRDDRFVALAPGTIDESGQGIGPDDHPTIPVSFTPPDIPVASAGLIADGSVDPRDTTAALLSLAVRGAIQMREEVSVTARGKQKDTGTIYARLVDDSVPMAPHEASLLQDVFQSTPAGEEKLLSGQGVLAAVHAKLAKNVLGEVKQAGWYRRPPGSLVSKSASAAPWIKWLVFGGAAVILAVFVVLATMQSPGAAGGWRAMVVVGPAIILAVGGLIYMAAVYSGQRSAVGRAYADQVAGFRQYIATAEADQIKFEEGQDIFSQYLPWAVIYGLTDRWVKVCTRLVELGRLPSMAPYWYYGGTGVFNAQSFTSSLTSVDQASMASSASGSGSGFSGGFSGGGGGGGGVGSW